MDEAGEREVQPAELLTWVGDGVHDLVGLDREVQGKQRDALVQLARCGERLGLGLLSLETREARWGRA